GVSTGYLVEKPEPVRSLGVRIKCRCDRSCDQVCGIGRNKLPGFQINHTVLAAQQHLREIEIGTMTEHTRHCLVDIHHRLEAMVILGPVVPPAERLLLVPVSHIFCSATCFANCVFAVPKQFLLVLWLPDEPVVAK